MNRLFLRKIENAQHVMVELSGGDLLRVSLSSGAVAASRSPGGPVIAVWPWYLRNKPTRRNRYAILNCARHNVEWWVA